MTIAALYVETNGIYYGLDDVDPWDEERDARLYAGPWPVVAHPPCARWSILAGMIETRYGYKRGDDGGCFEAALNAVRKWGGVLEHPAHSAAFRTFGLPIPTRGGGWVGTLDDGGWSCWIDQGWYGHTLKKPTWLYCVGTDPPAMKWGEGPGIILPRRYAPTVKNPLFGPSETERKRLTMPTPPAFRDVLLDMARNATGTGLDFVYQRAAHLEISDLKSVAGGERSGGAFQPDFERAENEVTDLVGGDPTFGDFDVQVDEDGTGHVSSYGTVTPATLPSSGADCEGRDGDTFLPSTAPVLHVYENDEATSLFGYPDGNGERW
jgi:hypothetical protein